MASKNKKFIVKAYCQFFLQFCQISNVEYVNGNKKNFVIAEKGIDEIGTGTAHSLVIPCSFTNNFNINDTIQIRNVSEGSVRFISNYVEGAINGLISIYKISE